MPNLKMVFKNAMDIIESLTDNHKNPLHIDEAIACWTYFSFVSSAIIHVEVGLNTTNDSKLENFLQESYKVMKSHQKDLSEFMRKEGVPLAHISEDKPESDPNAIPLGAKFSNNEICNTININFIVAVEMCSAFTVESIRTDVGLMFLKFQIDKLSLALKAKELMQEKGWLKMPPFYNPPGSPNKN